MMKVSIIGGAGNVGATAGYVLAMKGLVREVVLVDILAKPAEGKALDIYQATGVFGLDVKVTGPQQATVGRTDHGGVFSNRGPNEHIFWKLRGRRDLKFLILGSRVWLV